MKMKRCLICASVLVVALIGGVGEIAASNGKAPAYYIADFEVTDREAIKPYSERVESTFAPFSGRYIVRGGQMDQLEGQPSKGRLVIIAFDSIEQARAWYNSQAYAALRPIRQRSGHTNALIVEGIPN
jgi:uncharacterized protein (DUF1330 family)